VEQGDSPIVDGVEDGLNGESTLQPAPAAIQPNAKWELMPIDVAEVPAPRGEFILPAVNQVRLALALSDFSARWRGSRGLLSKTVSAGMTTICEFNQPRRLEMRNSTSYAIVLLRNEILEQALQDSRQPRVELQERYHLQDETMRHLIEVLLHEKRQGFQSGAFFLDGVAVALASYLIRHYSSDMPVTANFVGGLAPSTLRRCIALMEARLE
jgi:AraC family transcriptional regulator